MATQSNPLVTAIQSRLAQMQGGASPDSPGAPGSGGGPGGGGGMPASADSPDIGTQLAQQSSELHGADPGMILKQLQKIRDALGVMFIQTFQSVPNVAGHVSKTLGTLDRAIKEAQNAAQTASAVRPPVGFSLAQQGMGGPGGPGAAAQGPM
jgi:hypothetical protein